MKKKDISSISSAIENEGFDYAFRSYTSFEEIKDKKFHKLRKAYLKAAEDLEYYIFGMPFEDYIIERDENS